MVRSFQDVYISHINFQLGNKVKIDDLGIHGAISDEIEVMSALGLEYFSAAESHYSLAAECISRTIKEIGDKKIQQVVYATSTLDDHDFLKNEFGRIMSDLGLSNIYPVGTFLSRCNNFISAVRLAVNMILGQGMDNILVVLADRHSKSNESRIVSPGNYLISDCASSFLISTDKASDYKILGMAHYTDQDTGNLRSDTHFVDYLQRISLGIKTVADLLIKELDLPRENFKAFITGNYNSAIMKNYARLAGFNEKLVYSETLSETAHVYASAQAIALKTILQQKTLRQGDQMFVLGTGDYFFGSMVVVPNFI